MLPKLTADDLNEIGVAAVGHRRKLLELAKAGLSPTVAGRQLGLGRSTVYREVGRAGIAR